MATNLTGQDMGGWLWQQSDPNTQFNSYNPATGQWSAGSADGWSMYQGLAPEIERYLRAAGYGGRLDNSDSFNAWDAIHSKAAADMRAVGFVSRNLSYGDGLEQDQAAAASAPAAASGNSCSIIGPLYQNRDWHAATALHQIGQRRALLGQNRMWQLRFDGQPAHPHLLLSVSGRRTPRYH